MPSCAYTDKWLILDRLREIDIELMRRLSPKVNVIPVIGKADSLTPTELRAFKKRVSLPPFFVTALNTADGHAFYYLLNIRFIFLD
jgi:hypothetical protein